MPQVSVIVLTYNPDNDKLRSTLAAVAAQRDVELEVLISDDGSARKDFAFLPGFMDSLNVRRWRLLEHPVNRGTVASCRSAVSEAAGKYVFLTSPGDYLYDETVLRDLYRFAEENNAPLCFGNAVFYRDGELSREVGVPAAPALYAPGADKAQIDTCFFGGSWVIGAAYFRSRELLARTLEQISETCVYMEDTPSTMFALAAGEKLCYCDRNTVWYEDGTGVSTAASDKWAKLLRKDLTGALKKLKRRYPRNPYVDLAYINAFEEGKFRRLAKKLLRHPVLTVKTALKKRTKPQSIRCTEAELAYLKKIELRNAIWK